MERFGPFELVRPLGRGGMGEVYLARTPWSDQPLVAVKRLRRDKSLTDSFVARFDHEAQLAVRLAHAHLVAAIDVGAVGDEMYVASELVLGKDAGAIGDRLRREKQGAPVSVAVRVLADLLSALAYVHGAREPDGRWLALVHRDVTPGNVLIGYDGVARLGDFGLARSSLTDGKGITGHNEVIGTPYYLSPEVLRGQRAERPADIHGLGIVIYRLLTGTAPLENLRLPEIFLRANERPRDLLEQRPDLPPWLASLINEMLDPDDKRRPSDAWLLCRRLEQQATDLKRLSRASVGRWISALFPREHEQEIEEQANLLALDRVEDDQLENVAVYAHASPDRSLVFASGPLDDEQGTDVEFSRSDLLAALDEDSIDEAVPNASVSPPALTDPEGQPFDLPSQARTELEQPALEPTEVRARVIPSIDPWAYDPTLYRPSSNIVEAPPPPPPPPPREASKLPVQAKTPGPVLIGVCFGLALVIVAAATFISKTRYELEAMPLVVEPIEARATPDRAALLSRFEGIRNEIAGRNTRNQPVPDRAASLVADAASALVAGQVEKALPPIEELERILQEPIAR